MLQKSYRKETKTLNNMLLLSVITIAFHAYLTHLGLSPFQLLKSDGIYSAQLTIANNSGDQSPKANKTNRCVVNILGSMEGKNYC